VIFKKTMVFHLPESELNVALTWIDCTSSPASSLIVLFVWWKLLNGVIKPWADAQSNAMIDAFMRERRSNTTS
jgi:hypothetical protein